MLKKFLLCFFVGLSIASQQSPAWKENTEYTYDVRGRSLSNLGISDTHNGILLRAKFIVQPQSNGNLRCKISSPEYAEFQSHLPEGWMSNISDSKMDYRPLEISQKPFDVVLKNGVVKDLIMEQEVQQWEANIIKSFVSQFQLDTRAENVKQSDNNILPKEGSNNAVYKTVEDTVTGITETFYDIHPIPEYLLQSEPYLAPYPHLKGDGSIIEIVKSKNFTEGSNLPSYYFRFGRAGQNEPQGNKMGQIVHRSSMGRSVIAGTLQRYTIQFTETINEVVVSIKGEQRGSVNSMMRMKLVNAEQQNSHLPEISSPVHVGNLVYSYPKEHSGNKASQYHQSTTESYGHRRGGNSLRRHPRSIGQSEESSESSIESQEHFTLPKSQLSESPRIPFLPYFVGYKGESIQKSPKIRIVNDVISIAQEIAQDLETPQELPKRQTLSKFTVMTAVLRTMSEDQLKQVAQRLNTQETQGPKYNTWLVFRDSLAETGTGPALMVIKYLIESNKIRGNEASMVISSMAESVRIPSEEYMKTYYELVKNSLENNQHDKSSSLNETMLFSFAHLVHKVYVNSEYSHREYPTHSFGRFDTKSGKEFVKNEVIPYLTEKLRQAVSDGDSQQIYAYIHTLGEIGHPKILQSFEEYLEGKTPCSQFQRLLMVLSLYRVSTVAPNLTQAVLYRMYQNIGETTEIRVASIYMLMYTSPSAEMLQRIAKYTNVESNHKVCAAAKSTILSAAHLEGNEFAKLRSAAESASHFLTKKTFGVQDSQEFLHSKAFHHWESYYKHVLQTVAAEESGIPSSFYYSFTGRGNGLKYNTFSLQTLTSDIRNLFYVLQKQTSWYEKQQNQQESSQQSESSTWSSPNVARLLNLQTPELEQLEGGLFVHLGELKKHLIFNNHSIDRLPQVLEEALRQYESGKQIQYTTVINNGDSALAFPTEIGVPFLTSHESPVLVNVEGSVKISSQPEISTGDKLNIPDTAQLEADLKVTISAKRAQEFGFVAPFNSRFYTAGYDKNIQVHLPVRAKVNLDTNKKQVRYEIAPLENEEQVRVFHLSSWPHVATIDILDLKSYVSRNTFKRIQRPLQKDFQTVVGEKSVGMAFHIKYETDELTKPNIQSMIESLYEDKTQYQFLNVEYVPEKSKNKKVQGSVTYMRGQQKEYQQVDRKTMLNYLATLPSEDQSRVAQVMKYAPFGLQNSNVDVVDARVQFVGNQNVDYVASFSYARSKDNSKTRMLAAFKKQSKIPGSKPYQAAGVGQSDHGKFSGLDVNYVMNNDVSSQAYIDVAFGEQLPSENHVEVRAQLRRSEARKSYLMEQPSYHKCYSEMQQGNKQLFACANVTQMAGLLDSVDLKVNYNNMESKDVQNIIHYVQKYLSNIEVEQTKQSKLKQGEFNTQVRFSPDLHHVNVTVVGKDAQLHLVNAEVNQWAKAVFVKHPVFDVIDRLEGKLYNQKTYKPICTMDKTEAYTFDGTEYPLTLSKYWTVVMQYLPMRSSEDSQSSTEEQLKQELYNYVVLARQSSQDPTKKEVKIVVSTPETQGKSVEVTLKPSSSGSYPQVFVDGQQVTVQQNGNSETYQNEVSVIGIPNREVYVKVNKAFYVIYDGTRAKVTTLSMSWRNRVRGICGTFDGQKSDDFTTPSNCVVRDPQEFVASYTILKDGEHNSHISELKSRSQKNHCSYKKVPLYVQYIINSEQSSSTRHPSTSCTKFQTRYVVENGQTCFTLRPMSVCKSHCKRHGSIYKDVEVHCVQNRNVANLWKTQIDNGASPDFSHKSATKSVQLEVPQSCRSA